MSRKRTKVKKRVRIFLVVTIIIGVILTLMFLFMRVDRGMIESGTIDFQKNNVEMIIVRDVDIDTSASLGKITYIADEGSLVEAGESVAKVYRSGYNENLVLDLVTLQQNIKQYQIGTLRRDIADPQFNEIQAKIDATLTSISQKVISPSNDGVSILSLQRELISLLEERKEYLKKFQPDGQLSQLLADEEEYLTQLKEWQSDVTAKKKGRISFNMDAYENFLTKATLDEGVLTYGDFQDVKKGKEASIPELEMAGERSIYRIVSPNVFYCIISADNKETFSMAMNESYEIKFAGFYDKTYVGTVISELSNETGNVYVLQVDDDVEPFMDVRTVRASVSASFTGLSVPVQALAKDSSGIDGLYIQQGEQQIFVPVDVLARNDKDAIFRVKPTETVTLMPGVSYVAKKYIQ